MKSNDFPFLLNSFLQFWLNLKKIVNQQYHENREKQSCEHQL
jgi:hypothetical protein